MIVSILQRMGFPMAKPVNSRAGEAPPSKPSKAPKTGHGVAATEHAQEKSARRQDVKAKTGKDTPSKAAQSTAKAAPKPVAKPVAKVVAKPATKSAAKPVAKQPVAKPEAKPAAKPAPKAAPKVQAAPVVKVTKPVPKAEAKVAPVSPAKAAPVAAVPKVKTQVQVIQPVAKAISPAVATPVAAVPAKAGRPSSRLAQLTVPSMAQAVASTAAKASYAQSAPSSVIVPMLPSAVKKDAKLVNNWKTKPVADLTDAELLAMPDGEYMNDVQMAAFRLKLEILKRDILSNAGETTEHLREDTSVVPDPADRATIEEEHALELRTRDRERKLLKKIEQSITRIDAGDYGYCDETGEPIGVGRLLARPTATLSLEAQQRRELKQKMFGD
jgi:DnaK suppressor protein